MAVGAGLRCLDRLAWRRVGVGRCRHGDLRHRRSVHITVDRADEAAARFVFRVAARHQFGEPAETLLGPRVEDAGVQQFHVLLVYVDGFLLERKCCLIEVCS